MREPIDPENCQLDVRITVTADDAKVAQLLQALSREFGHLGTTPKEESNRFGRPGERVITFSITETNDFELEWVRAMLTELGIDGKREITGTLNNR